MRLHIESGVHFCVQECNFWVWYFSERDVETGEIGKNQDITFDSEEEIDLTDLTAIWGRRSLRPPRHMEDFL